MFSEKEVVASKPVIASAPSRPLVSLPVFPSASNRTPRPHSAIAFPVGLVRNFRACTHMLPLILLDSSWWGYIGS